MNKGKTLEEWINTLPKRYADNARSNSWFKEFRNTWYPSLAYAIGNGINWGHIENRIRWNDIYHKLCNSIPFNEIFGEEATSSSTTSRRLYSTY